MLCGVHVCGQRYVWCACVWARCVWCACVGQRCVVCMCVGVVCMCVGVVCMCVEIELCASAVVTFSVLSTLTSAGQWKLLG